MEWFKRAVFFLVIVPLLFILKLIRLLWYGIWRLIRDVASGVYGRLVGYLSAGIFVVLLAYVTHFFVK
jgi:hypothetical protein